MRLQTVGLGEARVTDVTFVRLFTGVYTKVTLQLERVWARVCTVRTLQRK
jgi:hypothetical protein